MTTTTATIRIETIQISHRTQGSIVQRGAAWLSDGRTVRVQRDQSPDGYGWRVVEEARPAHSATQLAEEADW